MFKKKKEEKEINADFKESENKMISKNLYKVILKEKTGNTTSTFAIIECKRWFDPDSEIPYLRNDKSKFLEVMPEQEKDYVKLNKEYINKEIEVTKKNLNEISKETDPEKIMKKFGNPENLKFKLLTLEAQIRALKYVGRSYMSFGINGEKEYTFIRVGSQFIPQALDSETYTAFYPPDSKKKAFAFTHRNKQTKHGMGKKMMSLALMGAWTFGLIFLFGTLYFFIQGYTSYTESEITQAKTFCVNVAEDLVENNIKQSNEITKIYEEVASKIEEPNIIVEGISPK